MSLIEKTGYSYSGVCDVVRNSADNAGQTYRLLTEVDTKYNALKEEAEILKKQLEKVDIKRMQMVSLFLHVHKAMGLKDDLIFQHGGNIITVSNTGDNLINYSSMPLTDFSKLNNK